MASMPDRRILIESYAEVALVRGTVRPASQILVGSYMRAQCVAQSNIEVDVPALGSDLVVLGFERSRTACDLLGRRVRVGWGLHDIFFIPQGQPCWFDCERADVFHIYLEPGMIEQTTEYSLSEVARRPLQSHRDPMIFELGKLLHSASTGLSTPKMQIDAISVIIAGRLLDTFNRKRPRPRGGLAPWQVRRATEYLHDRLDEDVSLATLSKLVKLSPFHFARAFKSSLGAPPHAYHRVLRTEEAKRLLAETDLSVTEIALRIGYEAPQTLARIFQRDMGISPSEYRRGRRS